MMPFLFGPVNRRLFGIFHEAQAPVAGRSVLLCWPFGQEAIRAQRMYRVLADRLAREGCDVLRFDFYGTGDSGGDDEAFDLEGGARDMQVALDELRRRTDRTRATVLGTRLGASAAVRAAGPLAGQLMRLVLWDPIVAGADYLQHLRLRHVETLEEDFEIHDASWRRTLETDPVSFTGEAIGFGISPALRAQIGHLDPRRLPVPRETDLHIVARAGDVPVATWLEALRAAGNRCRFWPVEHDFEWTSADANNTSLVPSTALKQLLSIIHDRTD